MANVARVLAHLTPAELPIVALVLAAGLLGGTASSIALAVARLLRRR